MKLGEASGRVTLSAAAVLASREIIMSVCEHEIVEWQQRDQGMHVVGWGCRWCSSPQAADYHHETRCRRDFCGADPVASDETSFQLSPEQFRIELERVVQQSLPKRFGARSPI